MDYGFKLDRGEVIQRVIHRHILDLLPTVTISAVLGLAAGGLAYVAGRFPATIPFPPVVSALLIMVMLALAAVVLMVGIYIYKRNVLIFTNVHLVQVEQLALFQRHVSQLSFLRVEDVAGRKIGVLQTIFNYGEIEVQSAGAENKFLFRNAPHPERLADEALEIHEVCLREKLAEDRSTGLSGHIQD